jgi:hypothetical protein
VVLFCGRGFGTVRSVVRSFVRGFVIDSMGLSLRVLEGDLVAAVIGSINVDGGKGGTDVSGRELGGSRTSGDSTRLGFFFLGLGLGLALELEFGFGFGFLGGGEEGGGGRV